MGLPGAPREFVLPAAPYLTRLRRALHRAEEAPQPRTAARVMNPVAKMLAPLALAAAILPPVRFLFEVIHLNDALEQAGFEVVESDLGECIV